MNEFEVVELIKSALIGRSYGKDNLIVLQEERFDAYQPDIIIKAGKKNIAAIEIKSEVNLTKSSTIFSTDFYFLYKIRFFIYTDGISFFIFDRFDNPKEYIKTGFNGFVNRVSIIDHNHELKKLKLSAAKIITKKVKESSDEFPQLSKFIKNYSDKISGELKLSTDYVLFFEGGKTDTDSFEHQFFRTLIDNDVPNTIYRYCSFQRIFQILNENTISMSGLPGMNDTTEPNYVDNYLNGSNNELWEMSYQSRASINRRFIMSCTTLPDNLMQWRLYGEDGRGAYIEFSTIKEDMSPDKQFYLGKVKYAKDKKHRELDFIKSINQEFKEKLFFEIKFISLYVWKHFFKPQEFEYEQEVRLLYIHQKESMEKKWIIAEPHSIVNPILVFDLSKNGFPLKIREVVIGPKRTERKLNRSQLEQMVLEKNNKIPISESKLTIYR